MTQRRLGAVEAGGTKFRAAIYDAALQVVDEVRIETTTPDQTLSGVIEFFRQREAVHALGVASFGPLIVDRSSPAYGDLAPTPKPGWSGTPILRHLTEALDVVSDIQTDVEAAAVAEAQRGAGQGHRTVAYVTVGTGIGVGIVIDGVPQRGRDHVELGHMPVKRNPDDSFAGVCPFHGDCLEGLASGPAMNQRWNARPSALDDRDDVWSMEAGYLAQLVRVLAYSYAPDRILFSGGVGARTHLASRIASAAIEDMAGYSVSHAKNTDLVATAGLGNDAGLTGAALLAQTLL